MFFNFSEILDGLIVNSNCCAMQGDFNAVVCDSRKVEPGTIFTAIKGTVYDGHDFIEQAIASGASLIIAEKIPTGVCGIEVSDAHAANALLQQHFYGYPDRSLMLLGVTGTNGKTTSVYLLEHILKNCNIPCGLLSTIEARTGKSIKSSTSTTPDSASFYNNLKDMKEAGMKAAVFELSSHALHQKRTHGINLRAAILTNITRDHLDYHGNLENYFQAKKLCFTKLLSPDDGVAVINVDDPGGERMARELAGFCRTITFGSNPAADWIISDVKCDLEQSGFRLQSYNYDLRINTGLTGRHNVENLTGAILTAIDAGLEPDKIIEALQNPVKVPGRLERYVDCFGVSYFVDYSHTPDAVAKVLKTLRKDTKGKLIAVFGAGGGRDTGKRPEMGKAAAENADILIVTSDNPRFEEPLAIIEDICRGIPDCTNPLIEPDRRKAIKLAVEISRADDVVLIAGKGHEDYQEIKGIKYSFSDAVELGKILEERKDG